MGLEGTLPYIAPEQTGRLNRFIDYRSDFYALGATLYELLTGQPLFKQQDPLEMIHAQIARRPIPPSQIRSDIPELLSQLVLKLLEKSPEERYQSSFGLKQDLLACLNALKMGALKMGKTSAPITLGTADRTEQLYISPKLYGRDLERTALKDAFTQGQTGQSKLILVTGYSGVGKSALVSDFRQYVLDHGGAFVSGKFDQYRRGIPYGAFNEALSQRLRQILDTPEQTLSVWRERLRVAVEGYGALLMDAIPELTWILGSQPPLESIPTQGFGILMTRLMGRVVRSLSTADCPLVMVLDDLQWADLLSIEVLRHLQTDGECLPLLLIGTYRSNEVDTRHPLTQSLAEIPAEAAPQFIPLNPLLLQDIQALLTDTLAERPEQVYDFAVLCQAKTQGNPFFLRQFLASLYETERLQFDSVGGCWHWSMADLQRQNLTEDVAEFMALRLFQLSENTREQLKIAACIGRQFNLPFLSQVSQISTVALTPQIQEALSSGLIVHDDLSFNLKVEPQQSFSNSANSNSAKLRFRFAHDRVQQAAYSLISDADRQHTHLQIARQLEQDGTEAEDRVFDLINHYKQAIALLHDPQERRAVAEYALSAGLQAKQSAAYTAALDFLTVGIALLDYQSWILDYPFTLTLYHEAAEAAFLSTNLVQVEALVQTALPKAQTLLDKVRFHEVVISTLMSKKQLTEAIDYALNILPLLGVKLPRTPHKIHILVGLLTTKVALYRKSKRDLVTLPDATHPQTLAAMRILNIIVSAAYYGQPLLFPLLSFKLIKLMVKHGVGPASSYNVMVWGLLLCVTGDVEDGYAFSNVALQLNERLKEQRFKDRAVHIFNFMIRIWKVHYRICQGELRHLYNREYNSGDLEFAAFSALGYCSLSYYLGDPLEPLAQEMTDCTQSILKIAQTTALQTLEINRQLVFNLLGRSPTPETLSGEVFDAETLLPRFKTDQDSTNLFVYFCTKTLLNVIFGRYAEATQAAEENQAYLEGGQSSIFVPAFYFFAALAYAALHESSPRAHKRRIYAQMWRNYKKLKVWAKAGPMNHQHHVTLLEAEIAWVRGRHSAAVQGYERAIAQAKAQGYINDEALSNERAARYHQAQGNQRIARAYLMDARYCYTRWGAKAKVAQIDATYPELLGYASYTNNADRRSRFALAPTADVVQLDAIALVKASQAISSEIELPKLTAKLMQISLEYGCACRALLFLIEAKQLRVQAECSANEAPLTRSPAPLAEAFADCPQSLLQYVLRTQETVVLDHASQVGQFTQDPYIASAQPQSMLCLPLLHQGELKGILYLENRLTPGAFTGDRIEVLRILAAQAAISLENVRLYQQLAGYSQTLEQRVETRTQELTQTLDILEATRAELVIENALLREAEDSSTFDYQVGGSLTFNAPTYVVRQADRHLYKAIRRGQYCHILCPRQVGKSSLRVQMSQRLQGEGFVCAAIDLSEIGNRQITAEQWYAGFTYALLSQLKLLQAVDLREWWRKYQYLPPIQRLGLLIEQTVLTQISDSIVVFIDEIDSVLNLPFEMDDFFIFLRACFNKRTESSDYQRLTFVLLGVATPTQLIESKDQTPFNIGQAIVLSGFQRHEAQPLLHGLAGRTTHVQPLLGAVLHWTGGQPFLTQKICKLIQVNEEPIPEHYAAEWVEQQVRSHIIEDWETKDDPQHLRTIRDRILHCKSSRTSVLRLYSEILQQGTVAVTNQPEESELLLSGLVLQSSGELRVGNPIYQLIFTQAWIDQALAQTESRLSLPS